MLEILAKTPTNLAKYSSRDAKKSTVSRTGRSGVQ